jgi:DNA-binding transcriptional LysR family regulator
VSDVLLLFSYCRGFSSKYGQSCHAAVGKQEEFAVAAVGAIDLNLLIEFEAVLEERNLTRAGAKLNLSQPTMSGALARLRRHFGDELLTRSGREYRLTPMAERLLPTVRQAVRQVERTFTAAGEFDPRTSTRWFSIAISGQSIVAHSELLRRVHELAPGVRLELWPVTPDPESRDRILLRHDVLIAPLTEKWAAMQPEVINRDRFVCVVDPANPRLRDGQLSLADLAAMPHAAARPPRAELDQIGAELERHGITPAIAMTTAGWLPLPFVVAGTDMVAIIPERLARKMSQAARVTVTPAPFGEIELAEAAWWHPARATDPALGWLRGVLRESLVRA